MNREDRSFINRICREVAIPALVGCLCLAARMMNATRFWINGTLVPRSPDPHFHLRLIRRFADGDWTLPLFDPLLNHPDGAFLYWPPGFDLILSLIYRPFQSLNTTVDTGSLVLGLTIPLMGTIAIFFLWLSVRRIGLSPLQSAALLLLAVVSHSLVDATRFGRLDHQAMELLGWSVFLWLYIRVLTDTSNREASTSRLLGALLGLSLFFWNGALILIGLINAAFLFSALMEKSPGGLLNRWKAVTLWTLPGALMSVLLTGTVVHFPFSAVYLSWFHLIACATPLGVVMLWRALNRTFEPRKTKGIALFLTVVILILLLTFQGHALMEVLLRQDLNAALVPESEGLFTAHGYSLLLQPLIFAVPFLVLGLFIQMRVEGLRPLALSLTGLLTITTALALLQIRFLPLMESVSILAFAYWLCRFQEKKASGIRHRATAILFIMTMIPAIHLLMIRKAEAQSFPIMKAVLPVMEWIKGNTSAEKAILSPVWGYGNYVVCLAERPTVSSAFGGTPAFERGIQASLLSAFLPGEKQLLRIMDDTDSRILLLPDMTNLRDDYRLAWTRSGMDPLPVHSHYELDRLYNWNNDHTDKPGNASATFRHLRLLYNGPHQVNGKTAFRIYERVRGAQITGKVNDLNTDYFATIVLLPSNGKPVLWQSPIESDSGGEFRIICPYSTEQNGDLRAISTLEIWDRGSMNVIQRYDIQEVDVQNGNIIDQPKLNTPMDH